MSGGLAVPGLIVLLPLLAAVVAAFVTRARIGAWLPVGGSVAAFALACTLPWQMQRGSLLLVDPLSAHIATLIAFVAVTTSWQAHHTAATRDGWLRRAQHALFLLLLAALLLAVLANNLGIAWIAMEAALLAAAVATGVPASAGAVAAGVRLLLVGGVGIALALFGSILLYLAARPVLGPGVAAMSWGALADASPIAPAALLDAAFAFLLIGYGTLAGLVPLHLWLPEAMAEAPMPVAAMLAGAMPAAALVPILRTRALLASNAAAVAPGAPMIALGLASVLFAGFALWRQRTLLRCIAFAAIAQTGVAIFAFGLGGKAAHFAGLMHLTLLALAASAAVHGSAWLSQNGAAGARTPGPLTRAAGLLALAGLPPFGLFASLFLIFAEAVRQAPLLAVPLGVGVAVSGVGLAWRIAARAKPGGLRGMALAPIWLHFTLVLLAGLAMPGAVVAWFAAIAGTMP
jgi:hydrogenase-4 component F